MRTHRQVGERAAVLGPALRRVRTRQGLSIERLAERSGVSPSMLSQIELGQSAPTVNTVWKIATALSVPFSSLLGEEPASAVHLLRHSETRSLTSARGAFTSRALFPPGAVRDGELYELVFAPESREESDAHAPGTVENLVVTRGKLIVTVGEVEHTLAAGDALVFAADVPHAYENPLKQEAHVMLVMTYAS